MKLILQGGTVLDGRGNLLEKTSVVVAGTTISEVIKGRPDSSSGDQVIDCEGRFVMPGMIDMHQHPALANIHAPGGYLSLLFARNAATLLRSGFTSIRCLGCPEFVDIDAKRAAAEGLVKQPRIFAAGMGLCPTNGHLARINVGIEVDGADQFRSKARYLVKRGADWLKMSADSFTSNAPATLEELKAGTEAFHDAGRRVAIHAGTPKGITDSIDAGADTIEHGFLLAEAGEKPIAAMVKKGTYLVPTLYIHERWDTTKDTRYSPEVLRRFREVQSVHPKSFRAALDAGVKIAMGSDEGGIPSSPMGEAAYELELMTKYGMDTMDAIESATGRAAQALGVEDKLGAIRPGLFADLLVVEGDPSRDIRVLGRRGEIKSVIINGGIVVGEDGGDGGLSP